MSRNSAALRSPRNSSFADALESMTKPPEVIGMSHEERLGQAADPRWSTAALRKAVSRLQSKSNTVGNPTSAPSRDPRRDTELSAGDATLSYERALRLLARVDLDSDDLELTTAPGTDLTSPDSQKFTRRATRRRLSSAADHRPSAAKNKSGAPLSNEQSRKNELRDSSPLSENRSRSTKPRKTNTSRAVRAAGYIEEKADPSSNGSASNVNPTAGKSSEDNPRAATTSAKRGRQSLQIDPVSQTSLAKLSATQQRRTVVSLRLSDDELEQLRLRADESGINVSAYVRSCVMEAENLRSQVRHVMAEVRALGAASLIQRQALPLIAQSEEIKKAGWMQSLRRAASRLYLVPFGAFRRKA